MNHASNLYLKAGLLCALLLSVALPPARAAEVIPAGTPIEVRLINGIDSSKAAPGEKFRASVADPVVVDSEVVIPRGADATVELVKTAKGQYAVKLHDVTVNGEKYEVASNYAELKTKSKKGKTAKRGAIGAAGGAAVGGIIGGGKGAAIGAVGAGTVGAVTGLASGKKVELAPETRLVFELRAPVAARSR